MLVILSSAMCISRLAAVGTLVLLALLACCTSAFAASPPAIESPAATDVQATDATIEFKINSGELATEWHVYLEEPSCREGNPGSCEATGGRQIWNGGTGPEGETVTVDIAEVWGYLLPDTWYAFRIAADNEMGEISSPREEFQTEAGPAPVFEEASVTNISADDATMNMKVNPNGLPTSYRMMITRPECLPPSGCDVIVVWFPEGEIPAATDTLCMSLDLPRDLQVPIIAEHHYHYRIRVTNSVGTAEASGSFATPAKGDPPEHVEEVCPGGAPGTDAGARGATTSRPIAPATVSHPKHSRHHHRHGRHPHRHPRASAMALSGRVQAR
jgi:hypothetical protein